ncbi:MAG: hypothetical protein PHE61_04925 [Candidatus Omnitrophica bacterium]|nr:hypothetical protein [Candidatus Omnitrophota bacterium]
MRVFITIVAVVLVLAAGVYVANLFLPQLAAEFVINQAIKGSPLIRGVILKKVHFVSLDGLSFEGVDVFPNFPGAKAVHIDNVVIKNLWSGFLNKKWEGECSGGGISFAAVFCRNKTAGSKSFRLEIVSPWFDLRQFADSFLKPVNSELRSMGYSGRSKFYFVLDTDFANPPAAWLSLELDKAGVTSPKFSISACTGKFAVPFTVNSLSFVSSLEKGSIFAEKLLWPPYSADNVSADVRYGDDVYGFSNIKFSCYNGACEGEVELVPKDGKWIHLGKGVVKGVSLEFLAHDVGGPMEGSQGMIEGVFSWRGEGGEVIRAEGNFISRKPGGRLHASFLRPVLDYVPENEARAKVEEALKQGDLFYFVEGSLGFVMDTQKNRYDINLDLIGDTIELKLDVNIPVNDVKALFRVKGLMEKKIAGQMKP